MTGPMMNTVEFVTLRDIATPNARALTEARLRDMTALLLPMRPAQFAEWAWLSEAYDGQAPMYGCEVRDTTGALLGLFLSMGHMSTVMHVEWYDPATQEFYSAGDTQAIYTQAVTRVLEQRERHAGPVPTGEDFGLVELPALPARAYTYSAGGCGEDCPTCSPQTREAQYA